MRALCGIVGILALLAGCSHLPLARPVRPPEAAPSPQAVTVTPVAYPLLGSPQPNGGGPGALELSGPQPLDVYVRLARQRNPEILAGERRVAAQGERIPQVTVLPDPMIDHEFWPFPKHAPQTVSGRMPYSLMLSQQVPWAGKLQLRGEVADLEAQMATAQLAETVLKVTEEVKQAYYEAHYYRRAILITEEAEKLLQTLYVSSAEARYRTGQTSLQDVLRAQVELTKIREQLIELRRQYRQAQADLAKLIAAPPEADVQPADALALPPVPEQLERLYGIAAEARPELREKLLAIRRDQRAVELAKLDYYPDVNLGMGWDLMSRDQSTSPVADGYDNFGFRVSFNLPVWREKLAAGVREAQERTAESAQMYNSTRNETFRLIRRLSVQARALEQQVALYRKELIPKADQALRVSAKDYGAGKGNVTAQQVIDNWLELLRFRVQEARLEASLGQTLASLERLLGVPLDRVPLDRLDRPADGACLGTPAPGEPPLSVPEPSGGSELPLPATERQ